MILQVFSPVSDESTEGKPLGDNPRQSTSPLTKCIVNSSALMFITILSPFSVRDELSFPPEAPSKLQRKALNNFEAFNIVLAELNISPEVIANLMFFLSSSCCSEEKFDSSSLSGGCSLMSNKALIISEASRTHCEKNTAILYRSKAKKVNIKQ